MSLISRNSEIINDLTRAFNSKAFSVEKVFLSKIYIYRRIFYISEFFCSMANTNAAYTRTS